MEFWPDLNTAAQDVNQAVKATRSTDGNPLAFAHEETPAFNLPKIELLPTDDATAPAGKRPKPPATVGNPTNEGTPITWTEVAERLQELRRQGERFTSQADFAKRIGCSPATVNKAISNTPGIQEWAIRPTSGAPSTVSLNSVILDNNADGREPDPAELIEDTEVDTMFRHLLEEAKPEERAKLNAMTTEEKRELARTVANDPDASNRISRRKA